MARLVLISIDGLLPEFYLSREPNLQLLQEWLPSCAYANSLVPVYPTVTFTNHVSMVTGCFSDRHGIIANTRFDEKDVRNWVGGESKDWHMQASDVAVPTLWEVAKSAGLKTAIVKWPITAGAEVDSLLPEVFSTRGDEPDGTWREIVANTEPALLQELTTLKPGFKPPTDHEEADQWISESAAHIWRSRDPDLMLVHFTAIDHFMHEHGCDSKRLFPSLERMRARLISLLEAIDLDQTCVMICGDHGFMDFKRRIHINALLNSHHWMHVENGKIVSWDAIAHTSCGQASIFLKDPSREEELMSFLRHHADGAYNIIDREALRTLRAFPEAVCAIDAINSSSMGQNLEGPWIQSIPNTRGEHGYLPSTPGMPTGFIAMGAGVKPGLNIGDVHICDIAPTAARILGFNMPSVDGRPFRLSDSMF